MKHTTKEQLQNTLIHAAATLGLVTVVGLVSNILILLVGYIITLPNLFDFLKGYFMNLDNQKLWLLYTGITQLSCMIGCGYLLTHIGASTARARLYNNLSKRLSLAGMFASVGLGTAVHGILCAFVSKLGMPYLVFASPVQYIARFLGKGTRSLFADVSYNFPYSVVLTAIFIYITLIFISCCIGYAVGFAKERRIIAEEEEENRRVTPPENVWSAEDAKQTPFAYRQEN